MRRQEITCRAEQSVVADRLLGSLSLIAGKGNGTKINVKHFILKKVS
jgi:hypothetical protein